MERRALLTALIGGTGVQAALAQDADSGSAPGMTSMVRLLAVPRDLDGKRLATAGYLSVEEGRAVLYLHEEDQKACLLPNALRVDLTADQTKRWASLNGTHVVLRARFSTKGNAVHGGALTAIESIDRVPCRA